MASPTRHYPIDAALIERIKAMYGGINLSAPDFKVHFKVEVEGAKLDINYANSILTITVLDKPWYAPASMVFDRIEKFIPLEEGEHA